jgi:diadenylate cyclase
VLKLEMLTDVLGRFVSAGVIAMLVVFQPEIRKFLLSIGNVSLLDRFRFLRKLPFNRRNKTKQQVEIVNEITNAIENLSMSNTGALIVFADHFRLQDLTNPGVPLQAVISEKLLESIFNKYSPLHDGAVIISNQKIVFAGSVLPVSESSELPSRTGLRHRSAVGITEHTDATAIVVSEETGKISYAHNGKISSGLSIDEVRKLLQEIITGNNF